MTSTAFAAIEARPGSVPGPKRPSRALGAAAESATYVAFDEVFERFAYPAGESHLRLRSDQPTELAIEVRATGFGDLAEMVTADRVLRRNGITAEWFVPYFPFARHDRRNDLSDGFELELALEMVSEITITIVDPHSEVAGQLIHIPQRSVVEQFRAAGAFDNDPVVVIPDAGAVKKTFTWLGDGPSADRPDVVQALKHRDPQTGRLSGFEVLADDLEGRPCIIVDDISDGGGTFLGLAAELKAANAGPLTLAVTHGLFTKGLEALSVFDRIFACSYRCEADRETEPSLEAEALITVPFEALYTKGARQ